MKSAENLFKDFFEREPEDGDLATVSMRAPEKVLVIGELDGVIYRTEDSKEPFVHRFKKSDRPLLAVSADGRQIYVLKGAYRFTDRGFVS